jgi:hypothetical protein
MNCVEAAEISRIQRALSVIECQDASFVDVLNGGNALVDDARRLNHQHYDQPGGDEALGVLIADDGLLAIPTGERRRQVQRRLGGLNATDDLDQLHDGRRVEPVAADDPVRTPGACPEARDRELRGVGCEHDLLATDAVQTAQ